MGRFGHTLVVRVGSIQPIVCSPVLDSATRPKKKGGGSGGFRAGKDRGRVVDVAEARGGRTGGPPVAPTSLKWGVVSASWSHACSRFGQSCAHWSLTVPPGCRKHWRDASGTNVTAVGRFGGKLVAGVQSLRSVGCSRVVDSATRAAGNGLLISTHSRTAAAVDAMFIRRSAVDGCVPRRMGFDQFPQECQQVRYVFRGVWTFSF